MSQQEVKQESLKYNQEVQQTLAKIANTIRGLSMDAVQKADSGHPGLPLGCAELGAYLYGAFLGHNPKNSKWIARDRFILSAGHGCMLLYSCLHLAGFRLSLDEIKNFRQWHSKTPGHPESHETDGVETTTGPLGQGMGNAVGVALGMKILADKFNTEDFTLFNNKIVFLAGDGCMMEGISHEVSSLAGHLKLNNLIGIYDANKICLDGPIFECLSEDTKARYLAYGWDVVEIDGNDLSQIHNAFTKVRMHQEKPLLIIARTVIGKGSPNKQGTHKVHGSPLGEEEVKATKAALGLPMEDFYVPQAVTEFFKQKIEEQEAVEQEWNTAFENWSRKYPEKRKEFDLMRQDFLPQDLEEKLNALDIKGPVAGRKASQDVLNALSEMLPQIYGGSADLSCSDLTMMKKFPIISPGQFSGRNIKFGVREFGMAAMATGLRETRMIRPFVGTFLTFSDYMRNAIRLASLMKEKVIYQFTHDSIFLGEDGPTHQPIEQAATLRAIPNLQVIRPSGVHEVKMAWLAALLYDGPTAILLSRQNVQDLPETKVSYKDGMGRGAYIVKKETGACEFVLLATGSELPLAMNVAVALEKCGKSARVVSIPCWELFDRAPKEYRSQVLGPQSAKRVSIEAGSDMGWHKYIGENGVAICMDSFGASAPASVLAKEFGFTVEAILERIL
jgi:transketolase